MVQVCLSLKLHGTKIVDQVNGIHLKPCYHPANKENTQAKDNSTEELQADSNHTVTEESLLQSESESVLLPEGNHAFLVSPLSETKLSKESKEREHCDSGFCTSTPTHQGGFFPEFVVQEKVVFSPISKPRTTLAHSCSTIPANNKRATQFYHCKEEIDI